MTENQEKEMFNLLRKCANGIQRLEDDMKEVKSDIAELKTDVAELKEGQKRLEKEAQLTNRSISVLAGELNVTKARVEMLEQKELSS
jgi:phage shock protein A